MSSFFKMNLTWHLSFPNVPEIVNGQSCFNVNYSLKHVSEKRESERAQALTFWTYFSTLIRGNFQ